jgi:hypothetical protein
MDSSYILPIGIFCTFFHPLLDLEANIYKLTIVCTPIFSLENFYTYLKPFFLKIVLFCYLMMSTRPPTQDSQTCSDQ